MSQSHEGFRGSIAELLGWYIPFIMVMFTVSPIFVNFIKLSDKYKIILFIVFAIVSFFIGR